MTEELRPCPFCGGKAIMLVHELGIGGLRTLRIEVSHDEECIIRNRDRFVYGFLNFDLDSESGKSALHEMESDFAKLWNRRAS